MVFLKSNGGVAVDLSRLFQSGVVEEFAEIQKSNNDSMSLEDTAEFWTQRARLDNRMKVRMFLSVSQLK